MKKQAMATDPELVKEFLNEAKELLENLDNDLVNLESDPDDQELLNRIFRAFHTIKGTSGFLGFEQLVELGHASEDVLQLFRSDERVVTPDVMDVLLEATDKIKELVAQVRDNDVRKIDLKWTLEALELIKAGDGEFSGTPSPQPSSRKKRGAVRTEDGTDEKKGATRPSGGTRRKKDVFQDLEASTIRVDVKRLDDLMNLVGELVLERNRLLQINREFRVSRDVDDYAEQVAESTDKIHFVTTELQLSVMKTRMVPIDRLFRKYPRMVRDLAREKDKEVELVVSGGETELDKTVIDQLGDPLVHLLRNSIDHGIEPSDVRRKAGKPRVGRVELSARQEGNHILILVKDDGKGIDVDKVKQKALEKKLVSPAQIGAMSEHDAMQLIFEPGFSTAEKVSDLSGRGVGMDVVRTHIRNLNGLIELWSQVGVGTEIVLKLPLTLAVMQALMVQVGDDVYAVPLASVVETLRIQKKDIRTVSHQEVYCHRESVLPLLRLQRLFDLKSRRNGNGDGYVVLIGVAEKRFGLMVDRLLGQEEVVIKSLGEYLGGTPGIAGGTITGDGRVRLIVDCGHLVELV